MPEHRAARPRSQGSASPVSGTDKPSAVASSRDSDSAGLTAVVVAFNGGQALHDCIDSLSAQSVSDLEIIVVDNASRDGSIEAIEDRFGDGVTTIRRSHNDGYAVAANEGWRAASHGLVAILNQDLILAPDCLELMRDALLALSQEALVTPKLVLSSDPSRVNAIGNNVHFSGVAWCAGLDTPADAWHGVREVIAVSGAAFLARRAFLNTLGGLEERYFLYYEDVDLSLRARLAGGTCVAACDAVAIHDWSLALTPGKFGLLERNRRALWGRLWHGRSRMRPFLLQAEALGWVYAVTHGWRYVKEKVRAAARPLSLMPMTGDRLQLTSVLCGRHPYDVMLKWRAWASVGRAADRLVLRMSSIVVPSGRSADSEPGPPLQPPAKE